MLRALLIVLSSAPVASPVASVDDALDEAIVRFVSAADVGDELERSHALSELVAATHVEAAAPIVAEYARAAEELARDRRDRHDLAYRLERRERLLAGARARAGEEAGPGLRAQEREVLEMRKDLRQLDERIGSNAPWCEELTAALVDLAAALPAHKARKIPKALARDVDDHPDLDLRLASIALLGELGPDGTTLDLVRRMERWADAIERAERELPDRMQELHEIEHDMQQDIQGRRKDLPLFYREAKKAANEERRVAREAEALIDAATPAAGRALVRESEKEQRKTLSALTRTLRTARGRHRLDVLGVLRAAPIGPVREALRETLEEADEPLLVARSIEASIALDDPVTAVELPERWFAHEHELVRASAYAAAVDVAGARAIPALIDRLDVEEGRLRTDVDQALQRLTGRNFHGNVPLWRAFWDEHGEGFEVPEATAVDDGEAEGAGLTFFGIRTESERVLFVLDVSGSMAFSTDPRVDGRNPRDPSNYPRGDEIDRMSVARADLTKALTGLEDGGLFNLVLYASDVWTWQDELVEMEDEVRAEVVEFIRSLEPGGGTNIYGALWVAFGLIGVESAAEGEWTEPTVDTIYFLSDGQASVGLTTKTDEILAFVQDRNRTAGVVIHTIGLGGGHDAVLLRRLAEENGGLYVGR